MQVFFKRISREFPVITSEISEYLSCFSGGFIEFMSEWKERNENRNGGKQKKRAEGHEDLQVIPDYNAKLNMLDPDSKMSKLVGLLIVIGLILYFCNVTLLGLGLILLGVILYVILRVSLKRKGKRDSGSEDKKEK